VHPASRRFLLPLALILAVSLALAPAASAEILKRGIGYSNMNFAKVILTYSWSGHYPGQGEVCLKPETIEIPAGGSVHLDPPAGFTPTDFVIISSILRGRDQGGHTVYDPPTFTRTLRVDVPCPAEGEKVWGFNYFGAKDLGPVFANRPLAMAGLDEDGLPKVVASRLDADGHPKINLEAEGHCMVASETPVLHGATAAKRVAPEFALKTTGRTCAQLIFSADPDRHEFDRPSPVEP
jgi:hypothetical protein